jgi:hypothetical protein
MVEVGRQCLDRVMEVEVGGDRADSRDRGMPSVRKWHYSLCRDSTTLQGWLFAAMNVHELRHDGANPSSQCVTLVWEFGGA